MARRLIACIFICFCAVLLMSHNSFAVDTVLDMSGYTASALGYRFNMDCIIDGVTSTNQGYCATTSGTHSITGLMPNGNVDVKKGDIIEIDLAVFQSVGVTLDAPQIAIINFQSLNGSYRVLGYKDVSSFYTQDFSDLNVGTGVISGGTYNSKVYRFSLVFLSDYNGQIGFRSSSSNYPLFVVNGPFNFKYFNGVLYHYVGTDINAEQAEKTQEASDQSEVDSGSAQNSAEGASQSLLSATGSIVSALTSAPATDCLIDISTRQFSVGQVNLCSNVPQGVLTFVHGLIGLVFTPIVLYFCYNVVTTLYNLFKEYNS